MWKMQNVYLFNDANKEPEQTTYKKPQISLDYYY